MASYQYTAQREKAAREAAAKRAKRPPRMPDAEWFDRLRHMRTHLQVLRNSTICDPDMRTHLDAALALITFTKMPTAKELRQRLTLVTRQLEYAFQIRSPKDTP